MGEYRLRLSAQADRDLRQIVEFIARDNPAAAERVGLALLERAELLKTFPTLGHRVRGTREDRVLVEGFHRLTGRTMLLIGLTRSHQ